MSVYTNITPVCDGWDAATSVGVLHFTRQPSDADVAALVSAIIAGPPAPTVEHVEAEDGTVV